MESVDEPVEHHVGEIVGVVVADLESGQDLLPLAVDFFLRERGVLRDVGDEVQADVEAVLHHDAVDEAQIDARAGTERAADRIDRRRNLLRVLARRALIEEGRRERRDAGPVLRILRAPRPQDQAKADRRLFMMRDRNHLEPVRERLERVRRKLDGVRRERPRGTLGRPVFLLRRRRQRQQQGEKQHDPHAARDRRRHRLRSRSEVLRSRGGGANDGGARARA